jgi:hypothetical protein
MKLFKRIEQWFELTIGWFFINGRKGDEWIEYLKQKYDKTSDTI